MAQKGRVKIDWDSKPVINAFTEMVTAQEYETAKRVLQKSIKKAPKLNREIRVHKKQRRRWWRRRVKDWQVKYPGALKKSIKLYESRYRRFWVGKPKGYIVWAGNYIAWYARLVEKGSYRTKQRRQRTTGRFTGRMPAFRYMRKAITSEKQRFMYHLKKKISQL